MNKQFEPFYIYKTEDSHFYVTAIERPEGLFGAFPYLITFNFMQDYKTLQGCKVRFHVSDHTRKNGRYPDHYINEVYLTIAQQDAKAAAITNIGLFIERKGHWLFERLRDHIHKNAMVIPPSIQH